MKGEREMATSLTAFGVFWACLSLAAAILNSIGFYLPFWMKGEIFNATEVTFGSFRRCNYPRLTADGKLEIVYECGRYTRFSDIPSAAWQASTILVGVGAACSLLVAFTALAGCCMADALTRSAARLLGLTQFLAGLTICIGIAVFPIGWNSPEVVEACGGKSSIYNIGACHFSWSLYLMVAGVAMLFLCTGLSFKASRIKPHFYRI